MGVPAGAPRGARRPSHVAYYVALVGILTLLFMLCLYFFYYFIKKIKELSTVDTLSLPTASCRPPPTAYPVQPVVRDSATAMAKLCKQVPAPGKGDIVFPTSTSPAALRASTGSGEPAPAPAAPAAPAPADVPDAGDTRPAADVPPDKAPPVPMVPGSVVLDVPVR